MFSYKIIFYLLQLLSPMYHPPQGGKKEKKNKRFGKMMEQQEWTDTWF